MKLTLRSKFMLWLVVQTLTVYFVLGSILYGFNLHERREHLGKSKEEREELEFVMGMASLTIPVLLALAWVVSGQLLKPLQKIVQSAEKIRQGALDHRVETDVPDDEIGRLARTINEAFDSYYAALQRLDRFSFDAAHQLRNPLAAIRTRAEVCLQNDRPPAEYQEAIATMLEDAQRLGRTVDQLLMLARLGRADMSSMFEAVDVNELFRKTLETLTPVFEVNSIELHTAFPPEPIVISGIPRLLEQAFANVLDNSVRFTPEGGRITAEMRRADGGALELKVTDTGPGIAADIQESLFSRWTEGYKDAREGSGLGLAITADIVRVHKGTISVSSPPGDGTSLTICIPSHVGVAVTRSESFQSA